MNNEGGLVLTPGLQAETCETPFAVFFGVGLVLLDVTAPPGGSLSWIFAEFERGLALPTASSSAVELHKSG